MEKRGAAITQEKDRLLIGWGMADITPKKKAALYGQFNDRVSNGVRDRLTVTALAMESIDSAGNSISKVIMVSCDACGIPAKLQDDVKQRLSSRMKDLNMENLFLAATHIHTAPYLLREGSGGRLFRWPGGVAGLTTPEEYFDFVSGRICDAVCEAWNRREKGGVSWQLGQAVVGHNRRIMYDNGTSAMYGNTDTPYFQGVEGPADHGIELLYTWSEEGALSGIVANVACPSQVVECESYISADYWGKVRQKVWETFGKDVYIFAMCGAAGDQSPRDLVRRGRGEKNMHGPVGMEEIAGRLLSCIQYKYSDAHRMIDYNPVLRHAVRCIELPYWKISKGGYEKAKKEWELLSKKYALDEKIIDKGGMDYDELVKIYEVEGAISRYREMLAGPAYTAEAHFVRIGNIAIATNPFELFTQYGLAIKARSVADQTFIAQLSCDSAGYLPTELSINRGSYSSSVAAGKVGPEGGQLLVDYSVKCINELWK